MQLVVAFIINLQLVGSISVPFKGSGITFGVMHIIFMGWVCRCTKTNYAGQSVNSFCVLSAAAWVILRCSGSRTAR